MWPSLDTMSNVSEKFGIKYLKRASNINIQRIYVNGLFTAVDRPL